MSGLDGLSYEQLKGKWIAFKGHLTHTTNQFEAALELPLGIDQAHSKVMIKVSKAEEVLEAMEAKGATEEHALEVKRGLQDCDQLMKWIGDKLKSQLQVENAGKVENFDRSLDDTDFSVEEILDKIQEFFRAQYNVIFDKVKFHKTIQHSNKH
ncbi:hypothetical protein TCAL_17120 [Tigriopus californicus]|uniref:Uncharacterized protein n=1 Tax=Tigriopus californicus TaxID=6832 RepID=A0A553P2U1_TIGCA|nr:hypothetical protein TCAL_17120 [Tigriopus californicus]